MGNPNFRNPTGAPLAKAKLQPFPKASTQQLATAAQSVIRLAEPRNLGLFEGYSQKKVLIVGLGRVKEGGKVRALWDKALYEQSANLDGIRLHIKDLVNTQLATSLASKWKHLKSSSIFLSNNGIIIGFSTASQRDTAGRCFAGWATELMPAATLNNAAELIPVKEKFCIYGVEFTKLYDDFLQDYENFEALVTKMKAKVIVSKAEERRIQANFKRHLDYFARNNVLGNKPGPQQIVSYRVISIRQMSNKYGVKTNTWQIAINSKQALELFMREGMQINFFGATVGRAYPWRARVDKGKAPTEPAAA